MRNKLITKELLAKNRRCWKFNKKHSDMFSQDGEEVVVYDSNDIFINKHDKHKRWKYHVTIMNVSNDPEYPWNVHIDNEDYDSIAGFEVKDIDHLNFMLEGYNIHVDSELNIGYVEPSWIGDELIARHAVKIARHYIRHTNSYPGEDGLTWKTWRKIVGHIIFSLEYVRDTDWAIDVHDWYVERYGVNSEEYKKFHQRVDDGLVLFGRYFTHLSW